MNFYTLTFKKFLQHSFVGVLLFSLSIFAINYIVDPYNITSNNLLHIKYKFARDDRTEKLSYFKTLPHFDNILLGSSRVYSINPRVISDILGGTSYNFGVGTAGIEDILGIVKYLQRYKKLPKNLIIGIDFYTFNKNVPPNKYFLKNRELNFLSFGSYKEDYLSKFFSFDALRASLKTLKVHFFKKNQKPRFDALGWAGKYENYDVIDTTANAMEVNKEIAEIKTLFFSDYSYHTLDNKRLLYMQELEDICNKHHINLFVFTTPLHPKMLQIIDTNKNLHKAMEEFLRYLHHFNHFSNLYKNKEIYSNIKNFHGATHTTAKAGDFIIKKVLQK